MEISAQFLVLVPIVLGLAQSIKVSGVNSRYLPLVSLTLGIGGVWLLSGSLDILQGIMVGLSASGLWSGTKASFGK